jgi:hypothetical protein
MNASLPERPQLRADYVLEGQFFAWPLAVPGECEPIDPDSAQICTVAPATDGRMVWGGTDGAEAHVFAALFKGAAGGVIDLGTVPEAFAIAAIEPLPAGHPLAVGTASALVLAWMAPGWELWRYQAPAPHDSVQEPGFGRPDPVLLASGPDHMVAGLALLGERPVIWGDYRIRAVNADGSLETLADLPGQPVCPPVRLDGVLWWLDELGALAGLMPDGSLQSTPVTLPLESEQAALCVWGKTLLAAADGVLFDLDPASNRGEKVDCTPLPEVQCLAGLPDGRAYGVCGHGIGHVFRVDRDSARCVALGAAATAVAAHRYGFEFSRAATTAEGVIFLGEHDRGGHLWAYYPPVSAPRG